MAWASNAATSRLIGTTRSGCAVGQLVQALLQRRAGRRRVALRQHKLAHGQVGQPVAQVAERLFDGLGIVDPRDQPLLLVRGRDGAVERPDQVDVCCHREPRQD